MKCQLVELEKIRIDYVYGLFPFGSGENSPPSSQMSHYKVIN